jgi:hypothetical protein
MSPVCCLLSACLLSAVCCLLSAVCCLLSSWHRRIASGANVATSS